MIFNKNVKDNKLFNTIIIFLLLIFILVALYIYRGLQNKINVKELSFINKELTIETNEVIKLNYQSEPNYLPSNFEWTTSNEEVATIDNRGYLKTLSPGEVTITIKANNMEAQCIIKVIEK